MVKNPQHVYLEPQLSEIISIKYRELKFNSKSAYIRQILKKEFHYCLFDNCFGTAIYLDFCDIHLKTISKKLTQEERYGNKL